MQWRRRPPPPRDRSKQSQTELEAFIAQARWLIEYHDRRADSLTTRATALLGFSGVILALLVRGGLPANVHVNPAIRITGIATIGSLLVCAVACLVTLLPGGATAPGVDELRAKWKGWVAKERRSAT
jgi:hypothetical protein